jgi:histidine triad (HIT) family protein
MNETNCIFCKIVAGDIPSQLVAESEHTIAFNDLFPRKPVHVLVVPKNHYANVAELAFENPAGLVDLVQLGAKVAEQLTDGAYRLTFNTGLAAGQTIFHAHGHVTSTKPKGEDE